MDHRKKVVKQEDILFSIQSLIQLWVLTEAGI